LTLRYGWQKGGNKISKAGKYKSSKIMALCNEHGQIQHVEIGNGGESDHKAVKPILKHLPKNVFVTLDKGFDSKKLRRQIRYRQARPICPHRQFKNGPVRRMPKPYIYKSRWIIEQAFSRTEGMRKLTVRYERNPTNYKQYWYLGLAYLELKKLTG
jgi:IS5 family transposase